LVDDPLLAPTAVRQALRRIANGGSDGPQIVNIEKLTEAQEAANAAMKAAQIAAAR
jgi:hypothetical protein